MFIKIVLPLVIEENTKIKLDRKKLFVILNKSNNSETDKKWLIKKFKQYGVSNKDLSVLGMANSTYLLFVSLNLLPKHHQL